MKNTNSDGKVTFRDLMVQQTEMRVEFNNGLNEVKTSVRELTQNFGNLEAGRLSRLETGFAELQGKIIATTVIITFIISTAIAITSLFLNK